MVPFADAFNHATPGVNHCHLEVSDLGLSAVGLVHLYLPIYLSVYPSLSFCLSLSLSRSLPPSTDRNIIYLYIYTCIEI